MPRSWRLAAGLAAALFAGAACAALTPAEEAGRKIYTEGASASGASIQAKLGSGGLDVPGTALPCANCHGADGLGRPEGGLVPSNIRWSELTKPYGHAHATGRRHPAFTEATVKKAFTFGVDPAGNELDGGMPRYRMSDEDAANLVAYLKRLESVLPPGVSAGRLRIGTVLPGQGRYAEAGRSLRGLVEAAFARVNAQGGLYGRRLELVVADYGEQPETAYANAWKLISEGDVFLLLAPFSAGWEAQLGRMAREERIPVVAPVTLFPEDAQTSNLYVFHLLAGVGELAQVLASHAADALAARGEPALVLHAQGAAGSELAESFAARLGELGYAKVLAPQGFAPGAADVPALARAIGEAGARSVFVLGPGLDLAALGSAGEALGARPWFLVPGPLAPANAAELPRPLRERVLLGYPTLPADQRGGALEDLAQLAGGAPGPRPPHLAQAYTGVQAMLRVLKDIGRDVSREKFVKAFEGLSGFDAGMLPPLSYNADRRIGAMGGYVVAIDPERRTLRPLGGYVQLP